MSSVDNMSASQLDSTWGCFFIGVALSSVLWGIGCLQLYLYCEKYWRTDQRCLKLYIILIWILDTVHQVLVTEFNYVYFVKGIINPELRTVLQSTMIQVVLLTSIINAMIQIILVRRTWCLSGRNLMLTTMLSMSVLVQFAVTMAFYLKVLNLTKFTQIAEGINLGLACNFVGVFTDTFLAVSLVSLLWKTRSGLHLSYSIVNRLVTYIIGTSLVTVLCMVIAVVFDILKPHSFIHIIADLVMPKLYFNCMLASLNVRSSFRENLVVHTGEINLHSANPSSGSEEQMNLPTLISSKTRALISTEYPADADIEAAQHE